VATTMAIIAWGIGVIECASLMFFVFLAP